MFAVFAVLFYIDGSTGYREKNVEYYIYQVFEPASKTFLKMQEEGELTPEKWREFAAAQEVSFPSDRSILPAGIKLPMPWPEILHDYERIESLQWKQWWLDYSETMGYSANPPEKAYDARTIREQWVFFYICSLLAATSLFFLIRTSRRSITATEDSLISQNGRRVPYSEFHRLDLRKWDNKGIAFAHFEGASGSGRVRIDGLTYGGFKKEAGSPAQKLMERLREHFSGEIIEYRPIEENHDQGAQNQHDASDPKSDNQA